jgi:hypothetical protein
LHLICACFAPGRRFEVGGGSNKQRISGFYKGFVTYFGILQEGTGIPKLIPHASEEAIDLMCKVRKGGGGINYINIAVPPTRRLAGVAITRRTIANAVSPRMRSPPAMLPPTMQA